ncbi:hypothetical protein, partial [Haemophilus influenzae]|uniref:hypothetical protein n=1 Tax=Haemophilus influenzae TaxID=727 RepID=UPI001E360E5E
NRKTPFPISVDNLFLKIWSDHDTACDETRRLQSARHPYALLFTLSYIKKSSNILDAKHYI